MSPPRLARALLVLLCPRRLRGEAASDLDELFDRRARTSGRLYAARRYWCDVLSMAVVRAAPAADFHPAAKGTGMISTLGFEIRQCARSLRRQPAFFAVAAVTLGIGFASHFAAFAVVDRLLLAPPAQVQRPERVFRLHVDRARDGSRFVWFQTPYRSYLDLRDHVRSFVAMAAYRTAVTSLGTGAEARTASVVFADADYFPLLGLEARLGRVFTRDEDRPPAGASVLVLSDAFWRSAFGADPGVLGRSVQLGAKSFTVIGVAPPGFIGDGTEPVDGWAPLQAGAYELPPVWTTSLTFRSVSVLVRLSDDTAPPLAAEEAAAAYKRTVEGTPAADATARVLLATLLPGRTQRGEMTDAARIALWLQGVALLVLVVALANVINLQLSRAAQRRREVAVRVALGASRSRLTVQLLVEASVVTITGAGIGVILTGWSAAALHALLLPGATSSIYGPRFGALAALSVAVVTLLCGGAAAAQPRGDRVSERLRQARGAEGFSRARFRQGLLVGQVMLSAILLVGAGLFLRSISRLDGLHYGIEPDRVLVVQIPLANAGYSRAAAEAFYDRALGEVASIPGVEHVSAGLSSPFRPSLSTQIFVRGFEQLPFAAGNFPTFYTVSPDYFATMGSRMLRGRAFTGADRAGAPPVIVVEEALGAALWPGQDPIGKCITLATATEPCREIVGVAANTRRFVRTATGALRFYVPLAQRIHALPPQVMFVRTSGDPASLVAPVRRALLAVSDRIPYAEIRVLRDLAEPETRPWRLGSALFVAFGSVAVLVAAAGTYALLSFVVIQRYRELGVMLALGASRSRTVAMVVRQSLGWAVAGVALGLATAAAAGRFIAPLLFETSPYDPAIFAATAALLLLIAAAASAAPAIRASRVDPCVALRAE